MNRKHVLSAGGEAERAVSFCMTDMPTDSDVRRMRKARRQARIRYAEIEAIRDAQAAAAFRAELGAVVRSASPLLISLLAGDGLTLDAAVALIDPAQSWPRQPRLSGRSFRHTAHNHLLRYYIAGVPPSQPAEPPSYDHTFHRANGNYVTMKVVDHSLELEARIAPVWLETRFGELRIQLDESLPETLAMASVGRLLEEIVDHDAWRGRGWRILDIEEPVASYFGQTLIVATGSVPYRLLAPAHRAGGLNMSSWRYPLSETPPHEMLCLLSDNREEAPELCLMKRELQTDPHRSTMTKRRLAVEVGQRMSAHRRERQNFQFSVPHPDGEYDAIGHGKGGDSRAGSMGQYQPGQDTENDEQHGVTPFFRSQPDHPLTPSLKLSFRMSQAFAPSFLRCLAHVFWRETRPRRPRLGAAGPRQGYGARQCCPRCRGSARGKRRFAR